MAGSGKPYRSTPRGGKRQPPKGGRRFQEPPSPKDFQRPLPKEMYDFDKVPFRPGDAELPDLLNMGLWLDKMVPWRKPGSDFKDESWTLQAEYRLYALEQMFCRRWHSTVGKQALERQRQSAKDCPHGMAELVAEVEGRLLIDAGRASAIETSLSFHHTWGVPKIAGSAIKGLVRMVMEDEGERPATIERLLGRDSDDLGVGGAQGELLFFDALPANGDYRLSLDVLTPHYQEYYQEQAPKPPADWMSPKPFTFLTVVDTSFVFHVVAASGKAADDLEKVKQALREGLEFYGIGGKKSAGYGRLVLVEDH